MSKGPVYELTADDLTPDMLHVHKVEVKRLRGDRSELLSGADAAFVATAHFRLKKDDSKRDATGGARGTKVGDLMIKFPELGENAELLSINEDAELVARVPMDNKSVEDWLADKFEFKFSLDGKPHDRVQPNREDKQSPPSPWITLLNTSRVSGDYFDLDVDVEAKEVEPDPDPDPGEPEVRFSLKDSATNTTLHVALRGGLDKLKQGMTIERGGVNIDLKLDEDPAGSRLLVASQTPVAARAPRAQPRRKPTNP